MAEARRCFHFSPLARKGQGGAPLREVIGEKRFPCRGHGTGPAPPRPRAAAKLFIRYKKKKKKGGRKNKEN